MMLTTNIMYQAGLWVLALTCLDEHEEQEEKAYLQLPLLEVCAEDSDKITHQEIIEWLDSVMTPEGKVELVAVVANIHGQCSHAWKHDVGLVFYHMGLQDNEEEKIKALYHLLMGCFGHGLGLADFSYERGDILEKAEGILGRIIAVEFKPAPCHFDQHQELYDLAATFMEARPNPVQ